MVHVRITRPEPRLRYLMLLVGTVGYLGICVDYALAIAEQVDVWSTRAERTCSARPIGSGSCRFCCKSRFPPLIKIFLAR
jgi:hypothetical protein